NKHLGETVILENRAGASGIVGASHVKNAAPDGYTLLLGTAATHGMDQALAESMPYDAEKDFVPVCQIANVPLVLVTNAKLPVNSLEEFIALLKQHPAKYAYAASGIAGPLQLAGELFKKVEQVDALDVPYKGSGPAMVDLVAGRTSFMFDTFAATNAHVADGTLKIFGVASAERFSGAPDLPTLKEQGYDVQAN